VEALLFRQKPNFTPGPPVKTTPFVQNRHSSVLGLLTYSAPGRSLYSRSQVAHSTGLDRQLARRPPGCTFPLRINTAERKHGHCSVRYFEA
jgi:hypothetical protein